MFKILKSFFIVRIILSKYYEVYYYLNEVNYYKRFRD